MSETLLVALLSLAGTAVGSIAGILTANKLTNYRIEQLEKKVSAHNEVIKRTYILEEKVSSEEKELERIEGRLHQLEREE